MFAISYTQLHRLSFLNVFNLVNVARRNDVIPRSYAKTLSIYQLSLALCTPTLSVTLQFHVFFFFVKRTKGNQDCILEIVSGYIPHLKIRKYSNSNKTGIYVNFFRPLFI